MPRPGLHGVLAPWEGVLTIPLKEVLVSVRWWQKGVIYQVYPRSFGDSDGDGVGDLHGIRTRLDHLEWLAIDAIWLSPIFRSPMADFGYDVADYTDIEPLFGSLADLDELITDAHRRGMRVLLDFVPNHSSAVHPWFDDSRSTRESIKRDWYIWRDPAPDGGPPNGWQAAFGGSAWEWDATTRQYYFHAFLPQPPDLNWANPRVRSAMAEVLRFWLKRGIDGFRIDVVWLLAKGAEIEPGEVAIDAANPLGGDQAAVHRYIAELRAAVDEFDDRLLIGEIYLPIERLVGYYGADGLGLHLPFNFQLLQLEWHVDAVHDAITAYEALLTDSRWPNWVLGNHDNARVAARLGAAQARVAAMLLLTLRGTPTIYYGDEIGMADVDVPIDAQRDPQGLRGGRSRDPARTPMRWDGSPQAGFTTGDPWLPIGPDVGSNNVRAQAGEPDSMLSLHRRLLRLRRAEAALNVGQWRDLGRAGTALAYLRTDGARRFLVCLNLADEPSALHDAAAELRGSVVISTLGTATQRFIDRRELAGDEGLVVLLD
ncbi:alpha-amylase family glycosyl hydrolase [soil metagenome]